MVVFVELEVPGDAAIGPDRVSLGAQRHVLGVADGPARERAGGLLDVLLGVVADAHREQLEQLAPEVLVDRAPVVVVVVQPHDHRGVPGELDEQRLEAAHAVAPEHPDLVAEHLAVGDLRVARREDAVPEQRHLLAQRVRGGRHLVYPVRAWAELTHHAGLLVVVAANEVVGHLAGLGRVQQLVNDGVVSPFGERLQLAPAGPESGAPREVGQQLQISGCGSHNSLPPASL